MNKKTIVLMTTLLMVGTAISFAPSAVAEPNYYCAVEEFGCYCYDSYGQGCDSLTQTDCMASAGPTNVTKVGVNCRQTTGGN